MKRQLHQEIDMLRQQNDKLKLEREDLRQELKIVKRGRPPEVDDVFYLLKSHSADWEDIGRALKVPKDFRNELLGQGGMKSNDSKLEDVLDRWIESQCSEVSWDHLIEVLQDEEMADTVSKIKEYLLNNDEAKEKYQWKDKSVSRDDNTSTPPPVVPHSSKEDTSTRHSIQMFKKAVERKGSISYLMVQCMPFGPPRVGKTCMYNLLLDKRPPGEPTTKEKIGKGTSSTDALTGHTMIHARVPDPKAIVGKGDSNGWSEVHDISALYVETTKQQLEETMTQSKLKPDVAKEGRPENALNGEKIKKTKVDQYKGLEDVILKEITKSSAVEGNVDRIQSLLKDSLTIFYTDTGGQPEFQEVLPALIAGPTIFLLTFNLFSSLKASYEVRYDSKEDDFEAYDSSFTVSEVLLQCLSSISCFKDAQTHQLKLEKDSSISSPPIKVLILGTHSDLVQQEVIKQADKVLEKLLINVDQDLIEKFKFDKNQFIIPINNYDLNDGKKLREFVETVVKRAEGKNGGVSPFSIKLPVHWLGLELYLRSQDKSTISYTDCVKIAGKFDIQDSELEECLKYLHYKVGTIRYYSKVKELEDIIIIKPGIIFTAITKLITSTFTQKRVNPSVQSKFKQYGLFKESEIQHIFEANEKSLDLTLHQFLALLRHLNILSRAYEMASHSSSDDHKESRFDYFLPCALTHAPIKDQAIDQSQSLVVSFRSGFVPKGIFSGLLACFSSSYKWAIECNSENGDPLLYRNQATFYINEDMCSLSMRLSEAKYLEFNVKFNSQSSYNRFQTYNKLRKKIEESLHSECTETLRYGPNCWQIGVYCNKCGQTASHVATVDQEVKIHCEISKKSFLLNKEQQCWFKSGMIPDILPEDLKNSSEKIETILQDQPLAKGIAFVTGVLDPDGVYVDLKNVKNTFESLKFIVEFKQNLTAVELACLLKAAANHKYPITLKFIVFYFAGHGGIDSMGNPFIVPWKTEEARMEESREKSTRGNLHIDHNIFEPFRCQDDTSPKRKRRQQCLFLFDCCLSESNMADSQSESEFRLRNPPPNSVVAYATSVGSKAKGDKEKGGLWTSELCNNLKEEGISLSLVLEKTRAEVVKESGSKQSPYYECTTGSVYLNGKPTSGEKTKDVVQPIGNPPLAPTVAKGTVMQNDSANSPTKTADDTKTTKDVLWREIYKCLRKKASCWRDLSLDLNISDSFRDKLKADTMSDQEEKLENIIRKWINDKTCEVSWEKIISVCTDLGLIDEAETLTQTAARHS